MPYITQLNGALVEVGADASIVKVSPTTVLNDFGTSTEFGQFNVMEDETGAGTVVQGDFLAPVVDSTPMTGTYLGSGFMANAGLKLGSPSGGLLSPNLGLGLTLNPINGNFFQDEEGNVHMITGAPLNADHLSVNLTVKLPLVAAVRVTVPLSELDSTLATLDPTGLLGGLTGGVTDLGQTLLDTAVVTLDFDPTDPMILGEDDINEIAVCYLAGTLILTDHGQVAIEELREGDLVVCRLGGLRPVRWIGRQHFANLRAAGQEAIRFAPGAIADNMPDQPLFVSPGHSMLVGETLVLAADLINGITITREAPRQEWSYFQIDLCDHDLVLANGAWSETFADCRDFRGRFDNAAEFRLRFPDHVAPDAPLLCAERPDRGAAWHAALRHTAERALDRQGSATLGPLEGRIEGVAAPCQVSGWAKDAGRRGTPIMLEVVLDGEVIGTTCACVPRKDARDQGAMGFVFESGRNLSTYELLRLVVRRAQDGQTIAPLPSAAVGELQGHLDLVTDACRLEGWVRDKSCPDQPVMLEVVLGEEILGTVLACRRRPDLERTGMGDAAFVFEGNRTLSARELEAIHLRRISDHVPLGRSEQTRTVRASTGRRKAA